jgi:very-short-patch-repair endonuclease
LKEGGRLGWWYFRPQVVKKASHLIKEVRVKGKLCDNQQTLSELIVWLSINGRLDILRKHWGQHDDVSDPTVVGQTARFEELRKSLEEVLQLRAKAAELEKSVQRQDCRLAQPMWHNADNVKGFLAAARAALYAEKLRRAGEPINDTEGKLSKIVAASGPHPEVETVMEAVRIRAAEGYRRAFQSLSNLERLHSLIENLNSVVRGLPTKIVNGMNEEDIDERLAQFQSAWEWARADLWFAGFSSPKTEESLRRELNHTKDQIADLILRLTEARAWGHCFSRMTEHERQHLVGWSKAMRRIGKGTGKYASMHRKAAREHLDQCRSAIPSWIMPIYRVAETVQPKKGLFDVVIVDEASQSGSEALFLFYIADKVIVVGDDKQISPEDIGLNREDVELLRRIHIPDLPHRDAIGPDSSLFSFAEIKFGGRIRLREHFRCMPEIIQFSNDLCYHSEPLIPLKQYGHGRLTPICVRHVPDGYAKGKGDNIVNLPEAEATANQIVDCCQKPDYEGKSIGVICLQGYTQAREIERILLQRLGPEEMEKRQIVCGNAYAFQGDERDIMFLSMVAAPSEDRRIATLASERDSQRFNVAASRAKEQVWLLHTATLNELKPTCLRYRLLQYYSDPKIVPVDHGLDVSELRQRAIRSNRSMETPPKPFESWFEIDVFLSIHDRGYRVMPQFEIAGYRIDLVVKGLKRSLAVECDGDYWHGLERYEEDMARQRDLERCGCIFWRIRESVFYRDPSESLRELWDMLERMRIFPTGHVSQHAHEEEAVEKHQLASSVTSMESVNRASGAKPEEVSAEVQRADGSSRHVENENNAGSQIDLEFSAKRNSLTEIPSGISLEPYKKWEPRALADPRTASRQEIIGGLLEIIEIEGPIYCRRAFQLYARAVGIQRVGHQIESVFQAAIRAALRQGLLVEIEDQQSRSLSDRVVHKDGSATIVLRTRGDRDFFDIPLSEIAGLMNLLIKETPGIDEEDLYRLVLNKYGIRRMTPNIRSRLIKVKETYIFW